MYDAVRGTIELMQADSNKVKIRTSYNMAAIIFSVEELAAAINKWVPLEVNYEADRRQKIADSWLNVGDSDSRLDWGWKHKIILFNLRKLAKTVGTFEAYSNLRLGEKTQT